MVESFFTGAGLRQFGVDDNWKCDIGVGNCVGLPVSVLVSGKCSGMGWVSYFIQSATGGGGGCLKF